MEELKFKIIADSSGADASMKRIATSTDNLAKSGHGANQSLKHLSKTFVGMGTGAESAAGAFKTLAHLGAAGIITASAAEVMNKFGEAVKENAKNYYETNKSLSEAFEQGIKSTSVEQADSALQSVNDRLEKIREEESKFSPFQAMLKIAEKLTGQDFGTHNLEKAKRLAEEERDALEEIVATRIKERDLSEQTSGSLKGLDRITKSNKIIIAQASMTGRARQEQVDLAQEEVQTNSLIIGQYEELVANLQKLDEGQRNQKLYQESLDKLLDARVQKEQLLLNLQKAQRAEGDKAAQATKTFGGGLLGASASGRVALETAQKQRQRQVKQENFKTQEAYFEEQAKAENARRVAKGLSGGLTAGDMKAREAEKVAAASAPTLAEQAQAQATGMSAEQVAISNVAQRQAISSGMQPAPAEETRDAWKGEISKTMQTMIDALNSLMSAPLVTSGAGGSK